MPKAKSVTKKTTRKTTRKTSKVATPAPEMVMTTAPSKMPSNKILSLSLITLAIALLVYKFGPWLVPAVIDYRPVTRFEIWSRLEKSYGDQALEDLVNEKTLDRAIAGAKVKVSDDKVSEQLAALETQFESTGGLDKALTERGMKRSDLIKQIKTQLAVEELLADKITPSEEEIMAQYESGKASLYQGKTFEEVKESITEELRQAKLRDEFLAWFATVKTDIKVKSFGL